MDYYVSILTADLTVEVMVYDALEMAQQVIEIIELAQMVVTFQGLEVEIVVLIYKNLSSMLEEIKTSKLVNL